MAEVTVTATLRYCITARCMTQAMGLPCCLHARQCRSVYRLSTSNCPQWHRNLLFRTIERAVSNVQ